MSNEPSAKAMNAFREFPERNIEMFSKTTVELDKEKKAPGPKEFSITIFFMDSVEKATLNRIAPAKELAFLITTESKLSDECTFPKNKPNCCRLVQLRINEFEILTFEADIVAHNTAPARPITEINSED
jgi:hypothetical protein